RVALTGISPGVAKRSINAQTSLKQMGADAAEEFADGLPRHYVQCVGAKDPVNGGHGPGMGAHVKLNRRRKIRRGLPFDARAQRTQLFGGIARLPAQPRQMAGEMYGMLAGSAADFEHLAGGGESAAQDAQNGLLIALGRLGPGQHGSAAIALLGGAPL